MSTTATTDKTYSAGESGYHYPGLGEGMPPGGADVLLLTVGGIAVRGPWASDGRYVAWSHLPKRDRAKERQLRERGLIR